MSEPSLKKILTSPAIEGRADSAWHITSLRVPFFEIDSGQALYHGNYYHLFEVGREDFLRKIGFPYREFMNRQLHLSVAEARCKYRKPICYDEQIELHTAVAALGSRGVSFTQLIYRPVDALAKDQTAGAGFELCTEAHINMICVHFTKKPRFLPEEFREAIKSMAPKG